MRLLRVNTTNPLQQSNDPQNKAALPLVSLAIPMILEQIFRIFVMSADTFMLSAYSPRAVAAVGLVNQYIFFIQILMNMVCIGAGIVLAQYLGAGKNKEAHHITSGSIVMVTSVAIVITVAVLLGGKTLLATYNLENDVFEYASQYLFIVGVIGTIWSAVNQLQSTVLRSYGRTKEAMYATAVSNIVNVIGNGFAIYGWLGMPITGVAGVAGATVLSGIVSCIILQIAIQRQHEITFNIKNIRSVPPSIYRKILSVGVPVAGENLSYNVSQIAIMSMITLLGTQVMSAHVYFQTVSRFLYIFTCALGSAVQIKIGYFVGAGKQDLAYRRQYQYQVCGSAISLLSVIILNIIKHPIIALFTTDVPTASLVSTILTLSFLIEAGRTLNLITIPALKGAGDVQFPVFFGLVSVWTISVCGSWFLGLHCGYGLPGIWIAVGSEECVRGTVMLFRWKSKRWMNKSIVDKNC